LTSWVADNLLQATREFSDNCAVSHDGRRTSYAEFRELVFGLSHTIASTSPSPRVAICAEASAEAYAAMFAALNCGGFYIPLNPQVGETKLRTALEDVKPDIVIGTKNTSNVLRTAGAEGRMFLLEDSIPKVRDISKDRPAHRLAYVMYTSGSTGKPKGVMISQSALAHYATWAGHAMQIVPADRWSQHPNIGFDLSVLDIYGALLHGATLCPLTSPVDRLLPARGIKRESLTIWNSVPSVMGMMIKSGEWLEENARSLRLMTFCGEPLLPEHVEAIFAVLPEVTVHNTYGPTEATVSCSLLRLDRHGYRASLKASVALGDPIDGTEFHILGEKQADTESGELLISGVQLADGYWNDHDRTAASFRKELINGKEVLAYHTGDHVERGPDGLYFTERRDNQVKVKGHRIELNEISSHIRKMGYINVETIVDDQSIISLVEGTGDPTAAEFIRQKLTGQLESYMQPNMIVFIPEFPRSANDKIDVPALRSLLKRSQVSRNSA
jgi:D-alanine--poly(phosphoribitol) ligase subunit 1